VALDVPHRTRVIARVIMLASLALATSCGARSDLAHRGGAEHAFADGSTASDARDSSDASVPRTYSHCIEGLLDSTFSNIVLSYSGPQQGDVVSVTQRGASVVVETVDQNHVQRSFDFEPSSPASARLAPSGQSAPGFTTLCVTGPGQFGGVRAEFAASAGTVAYDEHALFLSLTGVVRDVETSACGVQSAPADFWISCDESSEAPPASRDGELTRVRDGTYECRSQVSTHAHLDDGSDQLVASGGSGDLVISRRGAEVSATYTGDATFSGALRFVAIADDTATGGADQRVEAVCDVPITSAPPQPLAGMSVRATALEVAGDTVFVSVLGTMSRDCLGADKAVELVCRMR
jgi:hypothetical protein